MSLRVRPLLHLLLLTMLCTALVPTPAGASSPSTVEVREVPGGLRLLFEPLGKALELDRLTVEQARRVLATFREDFGPVSSGAPRFRSAGGFAMASLRTGASEEWEKRLREQYIARYGSPEAELPSSLARRSWINAPQASHEVTVAGFQPHGEKNDPIFQAC